MTTGFSQQILSGGGLRKSAELIHGTGSNLSSVKVDINNATGDRSNLILIKGMFAIEASSSNGGTVYGQFLDSTNTAINLRTHSRSTRGEYIYNYYTGSNYNASTYSKFTQFDLLGDEKTTDNSPTSVGGRRITFVMIGDISQVTGAQPFKSPLFKWDAVLNDYNNDFRRVAGMTYLMDQNLANKIPTQLQFIATDDTGSSEHASFIKYCHLRVYTLGAA